MSKRVLVCGGRAYSDHHIIRAVLNHINKEQGIGTIIHGGANGADKLGGDWGATHKVPVEEYRADWDTFGKSAGIRRNITMLEVGQPDIVVWFTGGVGTEHMKGIALKKKGVQVIDGDTLYYTVLKERLRNG